MPHEIHECHAVCMLGTAQQHDQCKHTPNAKHPSAHSSSNSSKQAKQMEHGCCDGGAPIASCIGTKACCSLDHKHGNYASTKQAWHVRRFITGLKAPLELGRTTHVA